MTVGARFPPSPLPPSYSYSPPSPVLRPPLIPLLLSLSPLPPLSPSLLFPSLPLACLYSNPQIQLRVWGSTVSSPSRSRQNPTAKRFWCIFRLKSAHLFHFHNVTFVISTVHFGCVQRRRNKIPVGATWGHCPHNFLAVGAIAPMESAPVVGSMDGLLDQ